MKVELFTADDGSLEGIVVGPSALPAWVAAVAAVRAIVDLAHVLPEQALAQLEDDLAAAEDATPDPPLVDGPRSDPLPAPDVDEREPAVAGASAAAGAPTSPQQPGGVVTTAPDHNNHVDERTRAAADELLAAGVGPAAVATELALPLALVRSWKKELTACR